MPVPGWEVKLRSGTEVIDSGALGTGPMKEITEAPGLGHSAPSQVCARCLVPSLLGHISHGDLKDSTSGMQNPVTTHLLLICIWKSFLPGGERGGRGGGVLMTSA
jgi:hypothetical protein